MNFPFLLGDEKPDLTKQELDNIGNIFQLIGIRL